nr:PREDICTED: uncharacterized protein LOC103282754 [Anolis carolinensis]|eukprot:XP_008123708.1 PREDICTED: uncharacterized protein LOC103282754 [Anolis carolinensis]
MICCTPLCGALGSHNALALEDTALRSPRVSPPGGAGLSPAATCVKDLWGRSQHLAVTGSPHTGEKAFPVPGVPPGGFAQKSHLASHPGHAHRREALPLPGVREELRLETKPHAPPGHAHWGEALHVPGVREELQLEDRPHPAPLDAHWREALPVRRVREVLQPEDQPGAPPGHPHRGEALQVPPVRQGLPLYHGPHPAPGHPHGREALQVPRVREVLQPEDQPQPPSRGSRAGEVCKGALRVSTKTHPFGTTWMLTSPALILLGKVTLI